MEDRLSYDDSFDPLREIFQMLKPKVELIGIDPADFTISFKVKSYMPIICRYADAKEVSKQMVPEFLRDYV